ncbi:MAG TPA: carbon storage regulator [Candidatus Mediterraneibacter norfolkensis]|nr:carbon storage regulator [Candidatus Mediterraneibacter norfolkensis]
MLTLGRNSGEYIVLKDGSREIVIQVAEIDGTLRLVVDAPRDIDVLRGEVYERTNPAPDWIQNSYVKSRKKRQTMEKLDQK